MFASTVGWVVDRLAGSTKTVGEYIASTVRPGEVASGRYPKRGPTELIARNQQTVYFCATTTAATCASNKLRLYTRASAPEVKMLGGGRTRGVSGKRLAYLRNDARVGAKAAGYADAGDFVEVTEHPLIDFLQKPNPWTTGWAYSYLGHLFKLLAGNDFQYFTDGDEGGIAAFHLFPQHTSIQPSESGFVSGYWYARDTSAEKFFEFEEVAHYPFLPSASDPYYGTGPLHACFREADILSYATDSELYRWINGGQPDWVVVAPPQTPPDQLEAIRQGIASRTSGVKNKGKFLVTTGGVEVKPGAFKPMELEYEKGMNRSDLVIARCFGMTEAQLLVNSANVASAREAARWWRETSILPIVSRDAEAQTEMLLPRFGLEPGEFWLAPDDPVPQDEAADMTRAVQGYGGGLLTLNEARAELGYQAAEDGGDSFSTPVGPMAQSGGDEDTETSPADAITEDAPKTEAAATAAGGADVQATALNGAQVTALAELAAQVAQGQLPEANARAVAEASFPLVKPEQLDAIFNGLGEFVPEPPPGVSAPAPGGDAPTDKEPEDDDPGTDPDPDGPPPKSRGHHGARRGGRGCECGQCGKGGQPGRGGLTTKDDRLDPMDALMRALGRDLETWYAEAAAGGIRPDGSVDLSPFQAKLDQILAARLPDIMRLGMLSGMADVGLEPTLDQFTSDATRFLSSYTVRLAREISDSETAALKLAIQGVVEGGASRVEAIAAVQSSGVTQSAWKADRIVRTETGIVSGRGAMEGWKVGGVTRKQWYLSANACPACEAFAAQYGGEPIDIDKAFATAGTEVGGITLWRDVVSGSEIHPNCACFTLPVMGDEEKQARARDLICKRHGVNP